MKRGCAFAGLICALMLMTMVGAGSAADPKVVRIGGPGSMFGRMNTISTLFRRDQPLIQVDFMRSADVDSSFSALIEKSIDIALTTRRITPAEDQLAKSRGMELTGRVIGHGGIVLITAPGNPINELTVDQVRKAFTGECTNWRDVGGSDGPITVVRVGENYPGTNFFMQEDLFGGRPFAANAVVVPEFNNVLRKVAQTAGSLGFVRIRDAFESPIPFEMAIKVLKVKKDAASPAVQPSRATIADSSYPILRPYYVYYESKADTNILKYVEFVEKKGWGQQNLL